MPPPFVPRMCASAHATHFVLHRAHCCFCGKQLLHSSSMRGDPGWVVLCRGPGPAPRPQTPWNKCVQNQLGFLIILFDILLDVDFSRTVMLRSEFSSNINRIRAFDGMDPSHVRLMCSGRPRLRSRSVQGLFWHILFTCGGFIFSVLVSEGAPNLRASRRVLA